MRVDEVDEAWLLTAARLAELELTADQLPGVLANFKRAAELAESFLRIRLDADEELAPVWRP
jgi:hypothetical protein